VPEPTPADIATILEGKTWNLIGRGTYNEVYLAAEELTIAGIKQRWVKKVPKRSDCELSNSARAVRLWNSIHTDPRYKAYEAEEGVWVAPFFGTVEEESRPKITEASDKEIYEEVLAIYRATGRIIVDACGIGNVLKYDGRARCVDMDYARRQRRGSVVSDKDDNWASEKEITQFLNSHRRKKPLTTSLIRTLLHIEKYLAPGEIKEEYLTAEMLAAVRSFRIYGTPLTKDMMDRLLALLTPPSDPTLVTNYMKEVVYLSLLNIAGIAITEENKVPPAEIEIERLELHVKQLKLPLLGIVVPEIHTFISEKMAQLSLAPWGELADKLKRLHTMGCNLTKHRLEILWTILCIDIENTIPENCLNVFIDKADEHSEGITEPSDKEKHVTFSVMCSAAEFGLLGLIEANIDDSPYKKEVLLTSLLIQTVQSKHDMIGSRSDVIEYLIKQNVDVNVKVSIPSEQYRTPLDYVLEVHDHASESLLRGKGALTGEELREREALEAVRKLAATRGFFGDGASSREENTGGWLGCVIV
jgi:hypothetical protein